MTSFEVNWHLLKSIDIFWRLLTSFDINWHQLTDFDFNKSQQNWLTSIEVNWRKTILTISLIFVNFCQFSSIFVNSLFLFFKILKIVRNCQKLSKNVKKRHGRQKTSFLTRHVNWRHLMSIDFNNDAKMTLDVILSLVNWRQKTTIDFNWHQLLSIDLNLTTTFPVLLFWLILFAIKFQFF